MRLRILQAAEGEGSKLGMHIGMVMDIGELGTVAVLNVVKDGRAQRAGLCEGDVIVSVNGKSLSATEATDSLESKLYEQTIHMYAYCFLTVVFMQPLVVMQWM